MTGMNVISFSVKVLVFLLLAVSMYFLVMNIRRFDPVRKLQEAVDDMDRQRILESSNKKKGFFERFMDRLDEQLTQAGIKRFLPKATVEIYFLLNVLEFAAVFYLAGDGIFLPLLCAGTAVCLNKLLLDMLRFRNRKVTEDHLLELLNMISDCSLSENEITMILYQTGQRMPSPLKEALTSCHVRARSTGNLSRAMYELRRSVPHPLFQEMMLLLELCSNSDNDYQKVVNGCRGMVNRYLKEEKEKAAVVRSLFIEAGIMMLIAFYGIRTMLTEFAGDAGFGNSMWDFFIHYPVGQLCLAIYIILFFCMIQVILRFARR